MKKICYYTFVVSLLFTQTSVALADYGIQTKTSGCTANQTLPDSACTPGAVLTTNTKGVCKVGYTKTVRSVSLKTRKAVFAEYGIPYKLSSKYEVDHLVSLEVGGSNDISNLWPEAYGIANGSRVKDKFENYLHTQVCKGKMTIVEAQVEISGNWLQYYLVSNKKPTKVDLNPVTQAPAPVVNPPTPAVVNLPQSEPVPPVPPAPTAPSSIDGLVAIRISGGIWDNWNADIANDGPTVDIIYLDSQGRL